MISVRKAILLFSFISKGFDFGLVSSLASNCAKCVDSPHGAEFENGITGREEGSFAKPCMVQNKESSGALSALELNQPSVKKDKETAISKSCLKKTGDKGRIAQVGEKVRGVKFSDPVSQEMILHEKPKIKSPNVLRKIRLFKSLSFSVRKVTSKGFTRMVKCYSKEPL